MTALTVKCCAECPFYAPIPILGALSELFGDRDKLSLAQMGMCKYDRDANEYIGEIKLGLRAGPERDAMLARAKRRMGIQDKNTIPERCPLRSGDVIVTLGS